MPAAHADPIEPADGSSHPWHGRGDGEGGQHLLQRWGRHDLLHVDGIGRFAGCLIDEVLKVAPATTTTMKRNEREPCGTKRDGTERYETK